MCDTQIIMGFQHIWHNFFRFLSECFWLHCFSSDFSPFDLDLNLIQSSPSLFTLTAQKIVIGFELKQNLLINLNNNKSSSSSSTIIIIKTIVSSKIFTVGIDFVYMYDGCCCYCFLRWKLVIILDVELVNMKAAKKWWYSSLLVHHWKILYFDSIWFVFFCWNVQSGRVRANEIEANRCILDWWCYCYMVCCQKH